jgi:hypothetical protein
MVSHSYHSPLFPLSPSFYPSCREIFQKLKKVSRIFSPEKNHFLSRKLLTKVGGEPGIDMGMQEIKLVSQEKWSSWGLEHRYS